MERKIGTYGIPSVAQITKQCLQHVKEAPARRLSKQKRESVCYQEKA